MSTATIMTKRGQMELRRLAPRYEEPKPGIESVLLPKPDRAVVVQKLRIAEKGLWPVIFKQLPICNRGIAGETEQERLKDLAKLCVETEVALRDTYDAKLVGFHERLLEENSDYTLDQEAIRRSRNSLPYDVRHQFGGLRMDQLAKRRREACAAVRESVLAELAMPAYSLLGRAWFSHARVNSGRSAEELYQDAKQAFARKAQRCCHAFLKGFLTGLDKQLYGSISRGPYSLEYGWVTHAVKDRFHEVDKFEETISRGKDGHDVKVKAKVRSTRTTQQVFHRHELLSPSFYQWRETLCNPTLMLPPRYRRLLAEEIPEELRPYLYSCFGTQINETVVACDKATEETEGDRQMAVFVEDEPCIAFCDVVLWGWGREKIERTTKMYEEHFKVLEDERTLRDVEKTNRGAWLGVLGGGVSLLLLGIALLFVAAQVNSAELAAGVVAIWVFSLAAIGISDKFRQKAKKAKFDAEWNIPKARESLSRKYPALDLEHSQLPWPKEGEQ